MTRWGSGTALLLAILCSGCASALREPPALAEIVPGDAPQQELSRDAHELLAEADLEMAAAEGSEAVERARRLYLEAAGRCEAPVEPFLGAALATAWLIEHESSGERRKELATEGVQIAQLCRRSYPDEPECRYRLALAVGQQARERPSTAVDGLDVMVSLLEQLIEETPDLDHAGPHRVLALVLLRAPGWPSGPGDPEYGLEHAQAAVDMAADYAPNQLVLAEALTADGRDDDARDAIERALDLARSAQAEGHSEAGEWLAEGQKALDGLK